MSDHPHAWEFVKSQMWAITEEYLKVIASVAIGEVDLSAYEALQTERGRPLANSRRVMLRGDTENVAIIPVTGPIFPRANLFTYMSGATSTEILAQDLRTALDDRTVDSIILDVDSPGGAVAGINELSDLIYQARQEKPVIAYAMHQMASAAFWIGSASKSIVAERTAMLGSIGVVTRVEDTRGRDERSGVRTFNIVSNVSPDKVLDPAADEGRAKIQKVVDDMAAVFVETVARNRGISSDDVIRGYGQGGVLVGENAVAAGMADRVGSMEQLIAEQSAEGRAAHNRRIYFMARGPIFISTTAQLREAIKAGHTLDEVEVKAADTAALEAAARAAGATEAKAEAEAAHKTALEAKSTEAAAAAVTTERARIASIQAIMLPGFEAEAQKAVTDGTTAEAFAVDQAKLQKERGTSRLQQRKDAPGAITHGGTGDNPTDSTAVAAAGWDKAVDKQTKQQERFQRRGR